MKKVTTLDLHCDLHCQLIVLRIPLLNQRDMSFTYRKDLLLMHISLILASALSSSGSSNWKYLARQETVFCKVPQR